MAAPQLFYQYPASLYAVTPNADGTGSWSDTAFSKINKLRGVIDDSTFIYFNPANATTFEADYTLTTPPTQVAINKITVYIRAWCRSHNGVTVDHTLYASLKPVTTRYDSASQVVSGTTNNQGDNPNLYVFGPWLTNPATGSAWTLSDLSGLKVGVRATSGDPTGTSTPYFEVSQVYVEIEAVPVSAFVESVRNQLSTFLRMCRKPFRTVTVIGSARLLDNDLFQPIWLENPIYPTPDGLGTWRAGGTPNWLRRPLIVIGQEIQPDRPNETRYTCIDPREYACTFWSPMRTDLALTDSLDGIAKFDQGGSWKCTRAGKVYCERPGDRGLREWSNDQLAFSADGLVVDAYRNDLLNSSFSQGAGNAFTNWTVTQAGTGTAVQDLADYLIEAAGLKRSVKITTGNTAGTDYAYLSQVFTLYALASMRVAIRYKNDSGSRMAWILRDVTNNLDWNDTTAAWVAAGFWNWMPVSTTPARLTSKVIQGLAGASNYTLYIGYMDLANKISHIYNVVFIDGSIDGATGMPLADCVTTTAAIATFRDNVSFGNDLGTRAWSPDHGTLFVRATRPTTTRTSSTARRRRSSPAALLKDSLITTPSSTTG